MLFDESIVPSSIPSMNPPIVVIGVFNSCETFATKLRLEVSPPLHWREVLPPCPTAYPLHSESFRTAIIELVDVPVEFQSSLIAPGVVVLVTLVIVDKESIVIVGVPSIDIADPPPGISVSLRLDRVTDRTIENFRADFGIFRCFNINISQIV